MHTNKAMKKKDTPNATTEVIRAAMKAVAKDVRSPKAVRDKIVKPKKSSPTFVVANPIAKKKPAYIILDDSIRIKNKNIIDISSFSKKMHCSNIFDFEIEHIPARIEYCKIEVTFHAKNKKMQKIMNLYIKQKKVRLITQLESEAILAIGIITSFEHLEDKFKFTYSPDYFEVR